MNDDWRLTISFEKEDHAHRLSEKLGTSELEHDLENSFGDRVIVSKNGSEVFCYTGTREQADQAERVVRSLADEHGWTLTAALTHWHPDSETWEDPDKPLPESDDERDDEHQKLIERERREAQETGTAQWEVRVDLPSHGEAVRFAEKLEAEGLSVVRRWKYLVVGATDEDNAKELAERLRSEAPSGSEVTAEGSWQALYADRPKSPFSIFGGLGG
jgi:hypothetical protein